jgi:hypothetical protein
MNTPVLVPEGIYDAALIEIRRFTNAFGERAGLVFGIRGGPHAGIELMESAALKNSPRGKLAALLRGLGSDGALSTELIGRRCRIAVRHETTRAGTPYAAIVQTSR